MERGREGEEKRREKALLFSSILYSYCNY